jgi:hypothetical protein
MTEMRVVVGSGPCAVGVTQALLQRGFEVAMLDVGATLDPDIAHVVERMAKRKPAEWNDADKSLIQRVEFTSDPSLPPKRLYGSTYPYFADPKVEAPGMKLYGSRAFGGLSTVWGCALVRARPSEMPDCPPAVLSGIFEAYPQVRDLLQQSIGADLFASSTHLKISAAAQVLWDRHRRSSASQQKCCVYPTPLAISPACTACNLCMYGCVYGYTYSSRNTIEDVFMQHPRFRYIGDVIVDSFEEMRAGVEIRTAKASTGELMVLSAKQLFVAAGMMGTLRILWNSSRAIDREVQARDSTCFLIPGLMFAGDRNRRGEHHGLSHLSVDVEAAPFETKPAHVQLYFDNPAVADGLKAKLGPLDVKLARNLVDFANCFVVAGQGYLHSDFCHRLKLRCDDGGTIRASVIHNPKTAAYIDAALSQFTRSMRKLGAYFVKAAANVTPYGGSKTAGALPHSETPTPSTTDPLGRPFAAKNVFVVDTTVIPAVPARNVTLTAMANALRIGQAA